MSKSARTNRDGRCKWRATRNGLLPSLSSCQQSARCARRRRKPVTSSCIAHRCAGVTPRLSAASVDAPFDKSIRMHFRRWRRVRMHWRHRQPFVPKPRVCVATCNGDQPASSSTDNLQPLRSNVDITTGCTSAHKVGGSESESDNAQWVTCSVQGDPPSKVRVHGHGGDTAGTRRGRMRRPRDSNVTSERNTSVRNTAGGAGEACYAGEACGRT